jgi:hypothetical protein
VGGGGSSYEDCDSAEEARELIREGIRELVRSFCRVDELDEELEEISEGKLMDAMDEFSEYGPGSSAAFPVMSGQIRLSIGGESADWPLPS